MDTDIVCEYVYKSPRTDFTQYLARFRCSVPVAGGTARDAQGQTAVVQMEIPVSPAYADVLKQRIYHEDRIIGEGIVNSSADIEAILATMQKK